ncbi:flagellar hook-length control protein FliK [Ruegeria aquimaris]|nr:flagellar hook-length control protein FliK [Ruegeria sp. XHP0148]
MEFSTFPQLSSSTGVGRTTGTSTGLGQPRADAPSADFLSVFARQGTIPTKQDKANGTEAQAPRPLGDDPEPDSHDGDNESGSVPVHATSPESAGGDHSELGVGEIHTHVRAATKAMADVTRQPSAQDPVVRGHTGHPEDQRVTWSGATPETGQGKVLHPTTELAEKPSAVPLPPGQSTDRPLMSGTPDAARVSDERGHPRAPTEIPVRARALHALDKPLPERRPERVERSTMALGPAPEQQPADAQQSPIKSAASAISPEGDPLAFPDRARQADPAQLPPARRDQAELRPANPVSAEAEDDGGHPSARAEIPARPRPQHAVYPPSPEGKPERFEPGTVAPGPAAGQQPTGSQQSSIDSTTLAISPEGEPLSVSGNSRQTGPGQPPPARPDQAEPRPANSISAEADDASEVPHWPISGQQRSARLPLQPAPHISRLETGASQAITPDPGSAPTIRDTVRQPLSEPVSAARTNVAAPPLSADDAGNAATRALDGWRWERDHDHVIASVTGARESAQSPHVTGISAIPAMATAPTETARHIANQMASAVAGSAEAGKVDIRLDPQELGSVQMSLKMRDGGLMMAIVADRPETLDLLRRHIDQLATEFRAMGYSDVTFSFGGSQNGFGTDRQQTGNRPQVDSQPPETVPGAQETSPPRIIANGLDIRL